MIVISIPSPSRSYLPSFLSTQSPPRSQPNCAFFTPSLTFYTCLVSCYDFICDSTLQLELCAFLPGSPLGAQRSAFGIKRFGPMKNGIR